MRGGFEFANVHDDREGACASKQAQLPGLVGLLLSFTERIHLLQASIAYHSLIGHVFLEHVRGSTRILLCL